MARLSPERGQGIGAAMSRQQPGDSRRSAAARFVRLIRVLEEKCAEGLLYSYMRFIRLIRKYRLFLIFLCLSPLVHELNELT